MPLRFILTALLALACHPSALAQRVAPVAPTDGATNSVTVAMRNPTTYSAAQFVLSVNSGAESARAPGATKAANLFWLLPLPAGELESDYPWRAQAVRYVTLFFTSAEMASKSVAGLKADVRLGYVEQNRSVRYSAMVPSDSLFARPAPFTVGQVKYQWGLDRMGFSDAWGFPSNTAVNRQRGTSSVGIIDGGFDDGVSQHPTSDPSYTNELLGQIQVHHGVAFDEDQLTGANFRFLPGVGNDEHGTFVSSIIAGKAFNGGIVGGCWNCDVHFRVPSASTMPLVLQSLAESGVSTVNFSGYLPGAGTPPALSLPADSNCDGPLPVSGAYHPVCVALQLLKERQISLVVSAGNHKSDVSFPARINSVIAVGGIDAEGFTWDEERKLPNGSLAYPPDPWDKPSGCPSSINPGVPFAECGSNTGPTLDFVAAARQALGAYFTTPNSLDNFGCGDDKVGLPNDGLGECTGTSFSAPHVTAAVALLRSANPLLTIASTYEALKRSTTTNGAAPIRTNAKGWGEVSAARAKDAALGRVGATVLKTRPIPMFVLTAQGFDDTLYTTKPQVAMAAYLAELYAPFDTGLEPAHFDYAIYYQSPAANWTTVKPIAGYAAFPSTKTTPRASFYLYSEPSSPYSGVQMKPLYRLSAVNCTNQNPLFRSHAYTTDDAGLSFYLNTYDNCITSNPRIDPFRQEGIEGFLLASCPPGMSCNGSQPNEPEALYRKVKYNPFSGRTHRVLLLAREVNRPEFANFDETEGNALLGYVMPNLDSDQDGLPNAFEAATNGLSPTLLDSDCDSISDQTELPLSGLQPSGLDPAAVNGSFARCPVIANMYISATNCTERTLSVSWFADPSVTQYQIEQRNPYDASVQTILTSTASYNPTFSTPPLNYPSEHQDTIRVRGCRGASCGDWGADFQISTGGDRWYLPPHPCAN
jgi:subtilisin family serine protease